MANEIVMSKTTHVYVYIALFLTIVIDSLGVGIVYPVFASIFNTSGTGILPLGVSLYEADILYGITLAAFPLAMFVGSPLIGDLSDNLGRKKVLLMCLFGESIGMLFCALSIELNLVSLLIVSRLFTGFVAGSMGIAQAAIVDISPEHRKTVNLSLISLAGALGFSFGPVAGGYFASSNLMGGLGYHGPFLFAALLAFLNGLLLLAVFKETFTVRNKSKINISRSFLMFTNGFRNRKLRYIAIVLLLTQLSWCFYFQTASLNMVQTFQYSISQLGHFISSIALIYSIALLVIVRILVRFFKMNVILFWGCIVFCIGLLVASVNSELAEWIAIIPVPIGLGLTYMTLLTLFSDAVDKDSQGKVMGIAASVTAAGWAFGAVAAGAFSAISFVAAFLFAGGLIFVCLFIVRIKLYPEKIKK